MHVCVAWFSLLWTRLVTHPEYQRTLFTLSHIAWLVGSKQRTLSSQIYIIFIFLCIIYYYLYNRIAQYATSGQSGVNQWQKKNVTTRPAYSQFHEENKLLLFSTFSDHVSTIRPRNPTNSNRKLLNIIYVPTYLLQFNILMPRRYSTYLIPIYYYNNVLS